MNLAFLIHVLRHSLIPSEARFLVYGISLHLLPYYICTSSEEWLGYTEAQAVESDLNHFNKSSMILSVHKTNTVNSIVSSDTAGSITDQLRQSTSSEQRQYAGNVNKVSCSASTSRGSSDTVVNQHQREVTSDRTDNSKRVESTGCLNQDANHSNVSANSRDLPPQGNG